MPPRNPKSIWGLILRIRMPNDNPNDKHKTMLASRPFLYSWSSMEHGCSLICRRFVKKSRGALDHLTLFFSECCTGPGRIMQNRIRTNSQEWHARRVTSAANELYTQPCALDRSSVGTNTAGIRAQHSSSRSGWRGMRSSASTVGLQHDVHLDGLGGSSTSRRAAGTVP